MKFRLMHRLEIEIWTELSFASSQWETALLCNDVSHWLGANLESALYEDKFWFPRPLYVNSLIFGHMAVYSMIILLGTGWSQTITLKTVILLPTWLLAENVNMKIVIFLQKNAKASHWW